MVVRRHAKRRQHGEIPVHGVSLKTFARHGDIIKAARPFAHFVEADEKFSAGQPGKGSAAGEALQINDEVEVLVAEPADAAEHFRPVLRFGPAFALETDDADEVGIAFDERGERGINPPVDVGGREVQLQQPQNRQRVDDVTERTGFEDENFQRP